MLQLSYVYAENVVPIQDIEDVSRYITNDTHTVEKLKKIEIDFLNFSRTSKSSVEKVIATDLDNIIIFKFFVEKTGRGEPLYLKYMVNEKSLVIGDVLVKNDYRFTPFDLSLMNELNKSYLDKFVDYKAQKTSVDSPAEKEEAIIYVFTDTSCGYCAKYYKEIPKLNEAGITVKHIPYPRYFNKYKPSSEQRPEFNQLANAICSENGSELLEQYFSKSAINPDIPPEKKELCQKVVRDGYFLGSNVGVDGTPATLFSNGKLMPGYRSAEDVVRLLKSEDLL
jgi:thiol:disulfide interchange protein DsbC